jgi:hypothetical protein
LLATASAALFLRVVAGCSTSSGSAGPPEAGPPGEAFTACQIQGYISESEGGLCPEGTCQALAYDTNGARIPCCTSIASGPAMCVDAAGIDGGAEAEPDAAPEDGGDAAETDSGPDAPIEAATDSPTEVGAETGATEAGAAQDAAQDVAAQ